MARFCEYCGEPITPGEHLPFERSRFHGECIFRLMSGSLAHQERRCGCFIRGATETDPPGMTKREAAKAALAAFDRLHAPREVYGSVN